MSSAEAVASLSPTRAQSHDARCSMYERIHAVTMQQQQQQTRQEDTANQVPRNIQ